MLPRTFRLSVRDNIVGLIRKGARMNSLFFVIRYRPNTLEKLRCAVVISSKIAPKAVQRNRFRRLCYRTVYDYIKKEQVKGIDLAILLTKKSLETEPQKLTQDIQKSLSLLKNL